MSEEAFVLDNPNGISSIKMVFNMLNQIIGIGIICYHTNFIKVGIIPCIILSILYGYLTSYSTHLLVKTSLKLKRKAWGDIVMDVFGVNQFLIFNLLMILATIVFGASYLAAAADWSTTAMASYFAGDNWKEWVTPGVVSLVLVGLSTLSLAAALVENLDKFAKVSIVSNIVGLGTIIVIVVCAIREPEFGVSDAKLIANHGSKIPSCIGIFATTYAYTQIALQLFYSLKKPSLRTWHRTEFCGMTAVIILHVTVGMIGYFAFYRGGSGSEIKGNILQNFGRKNAAINICRIGYAISILLTFPMQMLSGRKSAEFLFNYATKQALDRKLTGIQFRCITVGIWMLAVGVGIYGVYSSITSILSVGGCFVGCYMAFVLPAACFLWAEKGKTSKTLIAMETIIAGDSGIVAVDGATTSQTQTDGVKETNVGQENGEKLREAVEDGDEVRDRIGAWILFVVGLVLMLFATGISVYEEVKDKTGKQCVAEA